MALQRYVELTQGVPTGVYRQVFYRARRGASIRPLEFLLSDTDFQEIVLRANGACEVTGIPFSVENKTLSARRPFAPSLDRANSALPYTKSNCRLVACCVNAALSDWGEEVFRIMVSAARLTSLP